MGIASSKEADRFCVKYVLNKSFRSEVSAFGEKVCYTMAKAWCHAMEHLFDGWVASGQEDYCFPEDLWA
eukprot:10223937-Lingulodinium_polyedra.AAC.1